MTDEQKDTDMTSDAGNETAGDPTAGARPDDEARAHDEGAQAEGAEDEGGSGLKRTALGAAAGAAVGGAVAAASGAASGERMEGLKERARHGGEKAKEAAGSMTEKVRDKLPGSGSSDDSEQD
jgi:hypothetical protein